MQRVAPNFDEFVVLQFSATNEDPFAFNWNNQRATELDYGAALVRICQQYDRRA